MDYNHALYTIHLRMSEIHRQIISKIASHVPDETWKINDEVIKTCFDDCAELKKEHHSLLTVSNFLKEDLQKPKPR